MKILQINSVCGYGSTGRIATDLYKIYEEAGHECVIAYGRGTAPDGYKTIKIGTNIDNYMHVAKTRIFDKHGFGSTNATKEFIKKVKEYDPDVIHLHNIHGYYINIEILFEYLKKANKKVIWTLHDCWAFTGHCPHFDYIGCDKWKTGCLDCKQKGEYPSSKALDNSKWNYSEKKRIFTGINDLIIVTPSKWLAGLVKESFLGEYKVEVINNGIDTDIFKPTTSNYRKKYDIKDKKIILGVASVWSEKKGINYFNELENLLNPEKYKIIMIGLNKKQMKKMSENIIVIPRTNNIKELAEIYCEADLFVNSSLEETYPTTNLEALSCGTPVIAFDKCGNCEVIKDHSYGTKVKKIGSEYLANAIEMFRYIKLEVGNEFNKENNLNNYVRIIEKKVNK